jgi:acetyltransferase-like isoleucine patch superfamily enzyme
MIELDSLTPYADAAGNEVVGDAEHRGRVEIVFRGSNNRLEVDPGARFRFLRVVFDCSNGTVVIGRAGAAGTAAWAIRVGEASTVTIGAKVTTTGRTSISAVEGTRVTLGEDVMISSDVRIRGDDGHAIFDVRGGRRVNPARDITIGAHVWLGHGSSVLGGSSIGSGSVIGTRSVVTRDLPNNCVAVGAPARVVRRHIAWERPHLSFGKASYEPDGSVPRQRSRRYWNLTRDGSTVSLVRRALARLVPARRAGMGYRTES